jgi:hypothetical protein
MPSLIKLFAFVVFIGAALFPISALASSHADAKASGEGAATISGWTTSNIHYELASDPSLVKRVSFDLDAAASAVSVRLASNRAAYASCINLNAYHWQCDFPAGISVASLDEFDVIAVGD